MSTVCDIKIRPLQILQVGDQVSLDNNGDVVRHNSPARGPHGIIGTVVQVNRVNNLATVMVPGPIPASAVGAESVGVKVPGNRYCQTERLDRLLTKLQDLRGISRACSPCPVRMSCLAEAVIGYWCPKCCFYYIKEVDKRLDCDAYITHEAVEKGLCPTCDGGRETEVIRGFALDWYEE